MTKNDMKESTARITVAIPFVAEVSESPNIGGAKGELRLQAYWRCIFVALASAKILGGGDRIHATVFSNSGIPEEFRPLFEKFDIRVTRTDFLFNPPPGFSDRFIGSLFFFDAVRWIALNASDEEKYVLVDPDCFVSKSLDPLEEFLKYAHACVYVLRYPENYISNGQSISGIREWIRKELPEYNSAGLRWIGGEFLAITGAGARLLFSSIERIWSANLESFLNSRPYLRTEEHILSVAFTDLNITRRDVGAEAVRRLWTARHYYNVDRQSPGLLVWHLPSEKARGFVTIYERLSKCLTRAEATQLLSNEAFILNIFGLKGRVVERIVFEISMFCRRAARLITGHYVDSDGH